MIVASRIVLALLGALGAVSAGISLDLQDRFDSASYSYAAFGFVVLLTTIVGWAVGGLVGKLLQRGFRRVEKAAQARSAGELTVGAGGASRWCRIYGRTSPSRRPRWTCPAWTTSTPSCSSWPRTGACRS